MKIKVISFYSKILSFCLLLLGISSCDDMVPGGDVRLEYGTPSAKFRIKGTIKSTETQQAIKDIKVVVVETHDGKEYEVAQPVSSGSDGSFSLEVISFPQKDAKFELKLEDVDGELNGLFDTKKETVEFKDASFSKGDGKWYKGETEKVVSKIELTPTKKN